MAKRKAKFKLQKRHVFEPVRAIMTVPHHTDYMPNIPNDTRKIVPESKKGLKSSQGRMPKKLLKVRSVEHEHQY